MKLAKQIAREARQSGFLSSGARGSSEEVSTFIGEEFEKFITEKLRPIRDALEAMVGKAGKQNWNDRYPEQLADAYEALDMLEDE